MTKRDVHVVPRKDQGWAVVREKAKRASSLHPTQEKAERAGRATAKRELVELVTHNREGKIRDSDSYGHDPNPPKDTKH